MKTIGQSIKEVRKSRKLKQYQLADLIGVKHQSISEYERDIVTPSLMSAISIADALDVSLDELIGRNHHEHKERPGA